VRILHVIPYMHASAGGPPVVVENFVRETNKLGHESTILSTSLFCDGEELALLERLNGLATTKFLSQFGAAIFLNSQARRQFGESVRNADVVHVHTLWSPLNIVARWECKRNRRPYVLMPHGMLDPYSLSVNRWRKAFYLWAIERKNILGAECLIYTSFAESKLATKQLVSLPRGVVVPLGGDAPFENSVSLASCFLEKFPKARGRRQLLFLGRLHFKKGLDRILTVLPAIARVYPNVLLTIVGNGTPAFEATLKRTIAAGVLENNVMMTGRLDGVTKWGAYASAEIFLLPSRQENFAITVAEAMHMGIPVIISNRVNTWPYVKDSGAGLVLDETEIETQLKEALLSWLSAPKKIGLMGKAGLHYARTNLTWRRAASCLVECYENVLASRDPLKGGGTPSF
jgi:glycosyltransferase involved in cell wall biosynthesis